MKRLSPELQHLGGPPPHQSQAGMALLFSLLVLAALMLASVAMLRVINNGAHIAGNLAFQQDALMVSERATQVAVDRLLDALSANQEALNKDYTAIGFYANAPANLDPTGHALESISARALIQWDDNYCASFSTSSYGSCTHTPNRDVVTVNGNSASYIVFRLCNRPGSLTDEDVSCATAQSSQQDSSTLTGKECQGAINYENPGHCRQQSTDSSLIYRILVRTLGPRNTVSFIETLVYF